MSHFQTHRINLSYFHIWIVGLNDNSAQIGTPVVRSVGAGYVDNIGNAGIAAPHLAAINY